MPVMNRERSAGVARYADWFEDEEEVVIFHAKSRAESGWDVIHAPITTYDTDIVGFLLESDIVARAPLRTDDQVRARFEQLSAVWRRETRFESSLHKIATHPAYQEIIGLGPQAVPLIIDSLRDRADQWFWALRAIVGQDHAEGARRPSDAAARWIEWYDSQR